MTIQIGELVGVPAAAPAESPADATDQPQRRTADRLGAFTARYGMVIVLVGGCIVLYALSPTFRTKQNMINVLQQNSTIGVVAIGMAVMIMCGGFDLSVGVAAAAAGCTAGSVSKEHGVVIGLAAGAAVGLAIGLANGWLIAKARISPFVTTLGMQALAQGLLFAATDARPVFELPDSWLSLGFWKVAGIPFQVVVLLAIAVATGLVLRSTLFGKNLYAVGSNKEAARRAGVRVDRITMTAFAVGGLFAAVAGMLLVTQSSTGNPSVGQTWALQAIAAVVVGGVPLRGGSGTVGQAMIGVLLLGVMSNGLNLMSVSPYWQPVAVGVLVIAAVGAEGYRHGQQRSR
jgi:ribose/xylose/arabinose/galactoside ABC-type transport system permease subunit